MRVLDLFSGIGGFSLGLERAGFETIAFCEIDPWCRKILAKHWPGVPIHDDITKLDGHRITADVICGGFPCQDISVAGRGAGIKGERSGLWSEYARLIGEIRPSYAIIENVAALLHRGMGDVLGDLSALGYDAEWHCIPASAVGAPHRRDRVWIIAYPNCQQRRKITPFTGTDKGRKTANDARSVRCDSANVANAVGNGSPKRLAGQDRSSKGQPRIAINGYYEKQRAAHRAGMGWWATEPDVGRMAHGIPRRVDRLRGLGNAVVPQIPELIGRAIKKAQGAKPGSRVSLEKS